MASLLNTNGELVKMKIEVSVSATKLHQPFGTIQYHTF